MVTLDAGSKAEGFCADAKSAGWETTVTRDGDKTVVVAIRDKEKLSISWRGNACLNETTYEIDGDQRKLRNAAAARRQLTGEATPPRQGKAVNGHVVRSANASEKTTKKAKPEPFKSQPRPAKRLPFDLDSATDAEILKAVIGKKITWKNSQTGNYDSARVMSRPNQKHLKMNRNRFGERCITWAEADNDRPDRAGGGFRSVKLSAIISITSR